jgi:hypothetical protein
MDCWSGEDASTCVRCDALLCPLHTNTYQFAHQQCNLCVHAGSGRGRRRQRDDDSSQRSESVSSANDWYSDASDDEEGKEEEEEEAQQLVNTWFTQPHMNKRIRHTVYSKPGEVNSDDKCSICLDAMNADTQVAQLPCVGHHNFHTPCINQWLATRSTCPLCSNTVHVLIYS